MDTNGNGQQPGHIQLDPQFIINALMDRVNHLTMENTMQAALIQQLQAGGPSGTDHTSPMGSQSSQG